MAAPMRLSSFICQTKFSQNSHVLRQRLSYFCSRSKVTTPHNHNIQFFSTFTHVNSAFRRNQIWKKVLLTSGLTLGVVYLADVYRKASTVFADVVEPLKHKPIRCIRNDQDSTGLKLTLFQYQTCPFCCKVRAYLDYHGFSYNVVEVNSVWRTQTKWTKYKKVPILVIHGMGEDGYLQINDSSVIISILETYLVNKTIPMDKILEYYPPTETKNSKGKTVVEYTNKYFVMLHERKIEKADEKLEKEERDWRRWTDDVLVHTISPNIYRTPSEALQSFHYFSDVGQWDKVFTTPERFFVIYVGTIAMYFIGKMLKKRHTLKDDVRESLYDAGREWTKAKGSKKTFMGGNQPNLADISVYGSLNAMEGCMAFKDLLDNTKIGPWFYKMKEVLTQNAGVPLPVETVMKTEQNVSV